MKIQPPLLIPDVNVTSWENWLSDTEAKLNELGYKKYVQNHKLEDFCYWKTFKNGEDKIYQVGVLFYDLRKYSNVNMIGIMYECMLLLCEERIDMNVSKDIYLKEFEKMAETFFTSMSLYTTHWL